jgi:general secretion pathway protein D
LSACSANQPGLWPQATPKPPNPEALKTPSEPIEKPPRALSVEETPTPPHERTVEEKKYGTPHATKKEAANITLNFDQERLPTLIQLIYGTILKKNYTLDPAVASRTDLVTVRTGPQTPTQVEQTARLLLKSYGVAVVELGGGMFRIVPDADLQGYAPEVRRGRAMPNVPLPLRPIFQMVELQTVRTVDVAQWLKIMFGAKLTIQEDATRNAVMLSGQADEVKAGLEAIRLLDQPGMKGRQSARINPVYLNADEMAKRLSEVMVSEGYGAGTSTQIGYPVTFIPIPAINAVIVFAADPAILSHALDWARELDQPPANRGTASFFTYQAKNTDATKLAETLREMVSNVGTVPPVQAGNTAGTQTQGTAVPTSLATKIIVNAATNTLIFKGNNEEYTSLLPVLQELDRPTKATVIEVTVAEVNLTDALKLGVELSSEMLQSGALTALTALTGGAELTVKYLSSSGTAINMISALATQSRAKILSSPRLMARSGETATIQVGQQVPIVSSQLGTANTSSGSGNQANLLTAVQYKDVGVILTVKPVVYSGDRIELEVTQEVSSVNVAPGVAGSPIIDTKKVTTRLALKDGSTVMLGGLISNSDSQAVSGVPWLKDLPWLGQLFRTNNNTGNQDELIILITPYTVLDDYDAQSVTEAFRRQLGPWADKNNIRTPGTVR